jgi:hypothetical protein
LIMENVRFNDASGAVIAMEVDGQTLFVPADPGNRFYAAMVEAGIEPAPYAEPPVTLAQYETAIAEHVEAVARSRSYSSAASCAGYVNSTVPAWAAEAAAFVAWRDAVYLAAFGTMAQVQQGAAAPRIADLVAGLPMMEWLV